MYIAGLQKTSLIDYPGNICATVFFRGCNMRCSFCHNPELVEYNEGEERFMTIADFLQFLQKRRTVLDGVCITGGEPTIHSQLVDLIKKIKRLNLKVKLDTNGTNPGMLQELMNLQLVDYIAMDIKGTSDKYPQIVRVPVNMESINRSIRLLKDSSIEYEFRTTVVPELVLLEDLVEIGKWLVEARLYVLQQFRTSEPLLDPYFQSVKPYSAEEIKAYIPVLSQYVERVETRGM